MKPLGNNLLVIPDKSQSETKSGIIIPTSAQKRGQAGKVVSIGKSVVEINKNTKRVMFLEHSGVEIKLKGVTMLILNERDLLLDLEKE